MRERPPSNKLPGSAKKLGNAQCMYFFFKTSSDSFNNYFSGNSAPAWLWSEVMECLQIHKTSSTTREVVNPRVQSSACNCISRKHKMLGKGAKLSIFYIMGVVFCFVLKKKNPNKPRQTFVRITRPDLRRLSQESLRSYY